MAFEDAFRDLVLEQLKVDSTTIQVARENPGRNNYGERNYDAAIIRALDQAKTPCSTPTLALWYCYRYLNMHFDQFTEVINLEVDSFKDQIFSKKGNLLMIDVGCGPMTSCLAMADYHLKEYGSLINLHYIGIDNMLPMSNKASEFSKRADLFGPASTFLFFDSWASCNPSSLKDKVSKDGTLIINFSFFFGQPGIESSHAAELALFVRQVMTACQLKDMFVVFLNVDTTDYALTQQRYFEFRNHLGWKNLPYRIAQYRSFFPKEVGAVKDFIGPKPFRYLLVKATLVDTTKKPVET